jgi:CRISPR/Cas system CSM-associated protein Csm3 (group 7 of RAMP superfamily)
MRINVEGKEIELGERKDGKMEMLEIPIEIDVEKGSFLHIGAAPSPLTEKKGAVFKVDRRPVIPASSFKGALRHQLELLFIGKIDEFTRLLSIDKKELLKPCIPSSKPTKAEQELIRSGEYREAHCEITIDEKDINVGESGICPVCYFMGATGVMGFLRIYNLYPVRAGNIIDQTNIRIDRKTGTAAKGAKVDGEQIKPETTFKGKIDVIASTPQGFEFGKPRQIGDVVIDKWLKGCSETEDKEGKKILIEQILIPAIQNIKELGGQKSKGAGRVNCSIRT